MRRRFLLSVFCLGLAPVLSVLAQAPAKAALKDISVTEFRIRVSDEVSSSDDLSQGFESVAYPKKASRLSATDDQRLQVNFLISEDSTKKPQTPHQVFIRIASKTSNEAVVVVPQPSGPQSLYKLVVAVKNVAEQLNSVSGRYELSLIVGDAKLNPIYWTFGEIDFQFRGEPVQVADYYRKQPEIVHMFREPEKRPHVFVSNVFSLAVVGLFVLMLLLWSRVGIKLSNVTTSSILFQLSIGVILYIEYLFYLGNNMFTTLRYLTWAAPFALFFGRRMLAHLAKVEEQ